MYKSEELHEPKKKASFIHICIFFGTAGSDYAMSWKFRISNSGRRKRFLFLQNFQTGALRPTHPPIQWVRSLFPGCEADVVAS